MSSLHIKGLAVDTSIGVLPHEKEKTQTLFIDVTLKTDFTRAAETDDIANTIDYAALSDAITHCLQSTHINLIEAAAAKVSALIKQHHPGVDASVTVHKPSAVPHADDISFTLT